MKNQKHKGVAKRRLDARRRIKGLAATVEVRCYDNGQWLVNGDPCQDDLTAARLVAICLEALAHARTNTDGRWLDEGP
jgi:hypothetical protein